MSPRLVLQFLGIPQINLDNSPITTDRRKAVALLAYLAINRGKHTREFLSGLFWSEYEQAKAFSNLRRTIWEAHQVLGVEWLLADRETVELNPGAEIDLDLASFLDLLTRSRQSSDPAYRIPLLTKAAALYRNHFLTGFSLKDSYPFNEWAYAVSEELRRQLAEVLASLAENYCALDQAEKAIPHARRLISLEPLNESAHRQLMEVYLQAGQPGAALKQYQTCEQILRKELNLDPQPEMRALYKKIRKGEIKPVKVEKQIETITPKHNLPSQLSTFIGREKDTDEVANLLAKHRLVTLAGVGGIGKTRLSLWVGQRVLNDYPDGVWFIPLESLSDSTLVPQTVASVFDIRERSGRPVVKILMNALREKNILLIFDNCEHLLNACAELITALLTNCQNLKILATSREVLSVEGEATFSLPSLSFPDEDTVSIEKLNAYESVQLFIERAALTLSSFRLAEENVQSVVDICRIVDGIPLAIELAAARVNILQAAEILKQLQNSFTLLSSDGRRIAPRQQTIQASMDWSWGLLSEVEQRFLRQLSVFAGGWTLESAQSVCKVCKGDGLQLTRALVNKSLIVVKQETGRETRYRFHEIVRQYARGKLVESGEEEKIRDRHLKYFLQLSEAAETALKCPVQMEWYTRLNDERDNIHAALGWAAETDVEAGLLISGSLWRFWEDVDLREGERWLKKFLDKPDSHHHPHARAKALYAYGIILYLTEQYPPMGEVGKECLAIYRALGDKHGEIDGLIVSGRFWFATNDWSQAEEFAQQARALAESLGDTWRHAFVLAHLGWGTLDDDQQQISKFKETLSLFRKAGAVRDVIATLGTLANFEMLSGDFESAKEHIAEAMQMNQNPYRKAGIHFLSVLGRIESAQGNFEKARTLLEKSIANASELGNRNDYLWDRAVLGHLTVHHGQIDRAREILFETTQEFRKDQNIIGVCFSLEGIAGLYIATGKPIVAAQLIGWADATRENLGDIRPPLEQTDVDKIIAACVAKMGEVAFSDAYDEGQKMTLDEAVAYAL